MITEIVKNHRLLRMAVLSLFAVTYAYNAGFLLAIHPDLKSRLGVSDFFLPPDHLLFFAGMLCLFLTVTPRSDRILHQEFAVMDKALFLAVFAVGFGLFVLSPQRNAAIGVGMMAFAAAPFVCRAIKGGFPEIPSKSILRYAGAAFLLAVTYGYGYVSFFDSDFCRSAAKDRAYPEVVRIFSDLDLTADTQHFYAKSYPDAIIVISRSTSCGA